MTEGPGKIRKVNRPDYERAIDARLAEGWEAESRGPYISKLVNRTSGTLGRHIIAFFLGGLLGGWLVSYVFLFQLFRPPPPAPLAALVVVIIGLVAPFWLNITYAVYSRTVGAEELVITLDEEE